MYCVHVHLPGENAVLVSEENNGLALVHLSAEVELLSIKMKDLGRLEHIMM